VAVLIRGELKTNWQEARPQAEIYRQESRSFQQLIDSDNVPESGIEANRYHLYANYGDPWSHRVLIVHALKNLQHAIPLTIIAPVSSDEGWRYHKRPRTHDANNQWASLYELYTSTDPLFTGRVTVPLLWDSKTETIINNESEDIMRMLNSQFAAFSDSTLDLYPDNISGEIDHVNNFIFDNINNGVYKVGFANSQAHYRRSTDALFSALDEMDERLSTSRYLMGDSITEADIRLFVTLVRFDTIYHPYLKCNKKRLQQYDNLWPYTREIYQLAGVEETVKFDCIRQTYYSMEYLNPTQVIPDEPAINFSEPVRTIQYEFNSACFSLAR